MASLRDDSYARIFLRLMANFAQILAAIFRSLAASVRGNTDLFRAPDKRLDDCEATGGASSQIALSGSLSISSWAACFRLAFGIAISHSMLDDFPLQHNRSDNP